MKYLLLIILLLNIHFSYSIRIKLASGLKLSNTQGDKDSENKIHQNQQDFSMNRKTYIFGHKNPDTDSITAAIIMANFEKKIGNKNEVIPCRLGEINKETKFVLDYFDIEYPMLISNVSEADEVILVDHNEPRQSADDILDAKVVKLIDHHGLTGFKNDNPIFILTEPLGSTASVLYDLYDLYDVKVTKKIAGLMLSAILSDTLLLTSKITTDKDIKLAKKLAQQTGIDYEKFGHEMLVQGANITGYSEEQMINLDLKNFVVNGYTIQIAVLNSFDVKSVLERKEQLLEEINKYIENHESQLFIFVILDVVKKSSIALVEGELSKAFEKAFDVTLKDHEAFLPGINSRKSQIFPSISKVIEELPPYS